MTHRPPASAAGLPVGALDVFLAFLQIAISGMGGALFWARHVLVDRRKWLTEREFVDLLAIGQILPGPNLMNMAVMVGHRFAGIGGSIAALAGFVGVPFLVVLALGFLYSRYGALEPVRHALGGMTAVAAGMLLAVGLKMAIALPRSWRALLFGALAFIGAGVLRWPLVAILGVLVPLAIAGAWGRKS